MSTAKAKAGVGGVLDVRGGTKKMLLWSWLQVAQAKEIASNWLCRS